MPRRIAVLGLGCLLALGGLPGIWVGDAQAVDFTVDVTADNDDSSPGDGVCRATTGLCPLRAAVQEANALPGADVIQLRSGTYILQDDPSSPPRNRGDIDVTEDLTIRPLSGSPIIDGKALSRIFEVTGGTLVLMNLTLNAGNATSEFASDPACGFDGGAVCAIGADVRLEGCTVTGHRGENGGALFVNGGTLTLLRSNISGNTASSLGGGIAAQGAMLDIEDTTIADNKIDIGGSFGGGVAVYDGSSLDVLNSTFSGNTAVGTGGGLVVTHAADVAIRNSTFSGNTSSDGVGGAIDFRGDTTSFLLANVTIARNSGGGLMLQEPTGATVRNSLLVLNLPEDCTGDAAVSANNLLSKADRCGLDGPAPAADPKLAGTLETNGTRNATKTLALLDQSPADNKGSECEASDQRGFTRDAACDLGAYERLDDKDGDFVPEAQDNCPGLSNADQADGDTDGIGDACDCLPKSATLGTPDQDDDLDGVLNRIDCCPDTPRLAQSVTCIEGGVVADPTGCSISQACDCYSRILEGKAYPWGKRKGWKKCVKRTVKRLDVKRRCKREVRRAIIGDPALADCGKYEVPQGQKDTDGDSIIDADDNCRHVYNPLQANSDDDTEKKARGDACDDDDDNDNLRDSEDKCPTILSCKNEDADSDGMGNECDQCPWKSTGAGINSRGCEPGQDEVGAVEPPDECVTEPAPPGGGDDDDGEIIDTSTVR